MRCHISIQGFVVDINNCILILPRFYMIVPPACDGLMVDRMSGVIKMAELWLAPLLGAARCATSQLGDNKDMNSNPGRHHPPC